eukprot:TRINITY_DN5684_c0_g2_i8.p1 TRINITY_DN5684_c0_g2~~TRINITY_DN5684_c0_g2_i8.p1  ORF type:complete len:1445 (+),score=472.45 TRINITY_DN5684_c0_g2_i8:193-4527(+)
MIGHHRSPTIRPGVLFLGLLFLAACLGQTAEEDAWMSTFAEVSSKEYALTSTAKDATVASIAAGGMVDALNAKCNDTTFLTANKWIPKLCTKLATGPIQKLLNKALGKLAGAVFTEYDCCSVSFQIPSFKIGGAAFQFDGSLSYDDNSGELSISASNAQIRAVNKYVSMNQLSLGVTANLENKTLTSAEIDGQASVSFGFGDNSTGSVSIGLGEDELDLQATLETAKIDLGGALTLASGSLDLGYDGSTIVMGLKATAEVQYSSKNDPLEIEVEASYNSSSQTVDLTGYMNTMVPKVFGLGFLSVGKASLAATLVSGKVESAQIGGVLCVGSSSDCEDGESSSSNLLAQLTLEYAAATTTTLPLIGYSSTRNDQVWTESRPEPRLVQAASGEWSFLAKVNQLDVRKAVTVFADSSVAKKIPDILNIGLKPLQEGCSAGSSVDDCFFLIAVTNTPRTLDGIEPPVELAAGLSLVAKLQVPPSKTPSLLQLSMPINGAKVTLPGSSPSSPSFAKFKISMNEIGKTVFSAKSPIGSVELPGLIALGQPTLNGKVVYDINYPKLVPLVLAAVQEGVPGLKSLQIPKVATSSMKFFDGMMSKLGLQLQMKSDFTSKTSKYFAITGETNDGGLGLTVMIAKQSQGTGIVAALALNTVFFGKLMKGVLGTNPFGSVRILSNLNVAAYVSTLDFTLPDAVSLPSPFEDVRDMKSGFCFDGRLGRPTVKCGSDPVCAIAKKAFVSKDSELTLAGCVSKTAVSLEFGISDIAISKSVTLTFAGITYESQLTPPSAQFGATASLEVIMKDPVLFEGSLYLKQDAASTVVGFSFSTSGMIPKAFTIKWLQMYDLVLAAEVGVAAGVPVINSLTIGGGLCFGSYSKCKVLVSGDDEATLLERGHSTTPQHGDYEKHLALVEKAKLTGVVAAKLYAGFDLDGNVFMYAGITKVNLADIASAFSGSNNLPGWLSKIGLEAYDQQACDEQGGTACFAYMSYAVQEKTIDQLTPAITIPMGFQVQGRLTMFGASMGFYMKFVLTQMSIQLDASPLNMFSGAVKVYRLNKGIKVGLAQSLLQMGTEVAKVYDSTKGPYFSLDADLSSKKFKLELNGYAKIAGLGEAGVQLMVSTTNFEMTLVKVPVFSSPITMDLYIKLPFSDPKKIEIAASLDLSGLNKMSEPLVKATKAATKSLEALKNDINKAKAAVNKDFDAAKAKLKKAQADVDAATKKCQAETKKVSDQKKKCNLLLLQTGLTRTAGRRSRDRESDDRNWQELTEEQQTARLQKGWGKVGKSISKGVSKAAKTVAKTAKDVAASTCKAALSAATATMNAACTTAKAAANSALKAAQSSLSAVQKAVNAALAAASAALKKALEAIEFLTAYRLTKVGFKASGISASVALKVAILNTKSNDTKDYTLKLSLAKGSFDKMASAAFKAIFDPVKKAAEKAVKDLIKKIKV